MTKVEEGNKAPVFKLPTDGDGQFDLAEYKGQKVVVYFYPKDSTPGCTTESCDFRDNLTALNKLNTVVVGISKDSVAKHDKFKAKYNFNFPLASDEKSDVCEQYGVWVEKNMYGKKYMGIERSTFLVNENGDIEKVWRKVKVKGHVDDVLATLQEGAKAA